MEEGEDAEEGEEGEVQEGLSPGRAVVWWEDLTTVPKKLAHA